MKRVLFVDDEPNVLEGLKRMLHPFRHEREMKFAASGPEALEILAGTPAEVIVTDMQMPGINGGVLLTEVARRYPHRLSDTIVEAVAFHDDPARATSGGFRPLTVVHMADAHELKIPMDLEYLERAGIPVDRLASIP